MMTDYTTTRGERIDDEDVDDDDNNYGDYLEDGGADEEDGRIKNVEDREEYED